MNMYSDNIVDATWNILNIYFKRFSFDSLEMFWYDRSDFSLFDHLKGLHITSESVS